MGKATTAAAAAATPEMKRKKKGRPSKNPSPHSPPPKPASSNSTSRRSTRRNPSNFNSPPQPDFDDDEDERKEKKVKLVVRLPQSEEKSKSGEKTQQPRDSRHSRDSDSDSASGSEDRESRPKKRLINDADGGSDDGALDQDKGEEVMKVTDILPKGSPLESGPTTPLPDKKLLVFILDRLQKKDTYGVFSEPVDPNELPDYFEIIDTPMDFGTVRKKLDTGAYMNLEALEADVFLITSNAMQYNASDTIYYRQARAIQDLAKRDFENLKHQGEDGELRPKVVRRGRPPNSKNQKKSVETSPADRVESVATEVSMVATSFANGEDKPTGSNSYNLRKSPALYRFRSTDPLVSSLRSRNGVSECSADWNDEFPASILRADMKHTKRQFTVDENRRDTYKQSLSLGNYSSLLPHSSGNMKRLAPVGFQEALAYAKSLARYAANLGPVAWKLASKKIETVLPAGVEYGHGWVGEKQPPVQPFSFSTEKPQLSSNTPDHGDCNNSSKQTTSPASELSTRVPEGTLETLKNEVVFGQSDAAAAAGLRMQLQNAMLHHRNGVNGRFIPEQGKFPEGGIKAEQQRAPSVPPDLNVIVGAGSSPSSSSIQIGSPDLALQLQL